MDEEKLKESAPMSLLENWMKLAADFWTPARKSSLPGAATWGFGVSADAGAGRFREAWESTLRSWGAVASVMAEPDAMEGLARSINTLPDTFWKVLKPAVEGFFHVQQEWIERAGRIGKTGGAYKWENLDQEALRAWTEIYEKEFRQFLRAPQLGLTRYYQERCNEALDRFNVFQGAMSEFLSLIYMPIEKSLKVLQEQLASMAEAGKLPDKSKDYYKIWIKILEGHYMTLFQSPDYTEQLARALNAMGEFAAARQRVLEDALQLLPVPNRKEMDEIAKEIYLLKKRIKELEKKDKAKAAGEGALQRSQPSQTE
jgi:polyhydroxyalkanoate synthesis regulator phasin